MPWIPYADLLTCLRSCVSWLENLVELEFNARTLYVTMACFGKKVQHKASARLHSTAHSSPMLLTICTYTHIHAHGRIDSSDVCPLRQAKSTSWFPVLFWGLPNLRVRALVGFVPIWMGKLQVHLGLSPIRLFQPFRTGLWPSTSFWSAQEAGPNSGCPG